MDKNKEMDIFMIRQDRKGDITENVVVELKRPSVSLGDKQLEQHLVYFIDKGLTKIYVLKWSEIFDEFAKRHEYLLEKLKLEESLWLKKHNSADEAVEDALDTTAVMEEELIPKRAK